MTSDQSRQSFQCQSVIGHCMYVIQFTPVCSCLAALSPSDKPVSKIGHLKEGVDQERWKYSKETVIMLGSWLESNESGGWRRSSWAWGCWHRGHSGDSRWAAEGLQWRERDINVERGCDAKDNLPGEVTTTNNLLHIKRTLGDISQRWKHKR